MRERGKTLRKTVDSKVVYQKQAAPLVTCHLFLLKGRFMTLLAHMPADGAPHLLKRSSFFARLPSYR